MKVLVTGAAGFIGYHVANSLLARGDHVVGLDNLNSYYSINLKRDRLKNITSKNFTFVEADLSSYSDLNKIFLKHDFDGIIHLGAQAGVRYSIENPNVYIDSNINGFLISRFNIKRGAAVLPVPCRCQSPTHILNLETLSF